MDDRPGDACPVSNRTISATMLRNMSVLACCVLFFTASNAWILLLIFSVPRFCWGWGDSCAMELAGFLSQGSAVAQFALHAIWCVFTPERLPKRLAWGVGVALIPTNVGLLLLVLRELVTPSGLWGVRADFLIPLLCFPAALLALQWPLTVVRDRFFWRIAFPANADWSSDTGGGRKPRRAVVGGTLLAVLAAACSAGDRGGEVLCNMLLVAAALSALSLLTALPVLAATLRPGGLSLRFLALFLWSHTIVVGVWALLQSGIYIATVSAVHIAALTSVMLGVRALGLRLYWGRVPSSATSDEEHADTTDKRSSATTPP